MNKVNWVAGIIILLLPALFVMKYTAVPYPFYAEDVAVFKIAFQHTGQRVKEYDEIGSLREMAKKYREELKKHKQVKMNLKSKQSTTRERFPVEIELFIDGKSLSKKEYQPAGRQKDAVSVIYDVIELSPGKHSIKILMKDSKKEGTKAYVFEDTVEFGSREVKVVTFNKIKDKLLWSENLIPILQRPEYANTES